MPSRRWDDDARGVGVADARDWRPVVERLAGVVGERGWVAEEPEVHLLPHLEAAAEDGPLAIRATRTDGDGTFVVDLVPRGGAEPDRRTLRRALFALISPIVETISVIHEPPASRGRVLEVLTGSGGDDEPFAGHGHTIRLVVADVRSSGE